MTAARMSPNTPLLAKAEQALSRHQWFEAERLALKALELARAAREFDEMARHTTPAHASGCGDWQDHDRE